MVWCADLGTPFSNPHPLCGRGSLGGLPETPLPKTRLAEPAFLDASLSWCPQNAILAVLNQRISNPLRWANHFWKAFVPKMSCLLKVVLFFWFIR